MYLLLVTARESRGDVVAGLDAGADDYIIKPFDPEELRARVAVGIRVLGLQQKLAERVAELQAALSNVKQLRGLLPICSYCKRIRGDDQYWQQVEGYIAEHSDAQFSHGICPTCYEKVSAELDEMSRQQARRQKSGRAGDVYGRAGDLLDDLLRERQADAAGRVVDAAARDASGRSRTCTAARSASAALRCAWPTGSAARSTPGIVIACAPLSSLQPLRLIDFLDRRVDRQARQVRASRTRSCAPSACRRASARRATRGRG